MNAPLKLVVFDMDGTLIDSAAFIQHAMIYACGKIGRRVPEPEEVLSIIGLSLPEAIGQLMPELSGAERDEAVELYKQSFIDLRAKLGGEGAVSMYEGAMDVLNRLQAQDEVLMGIATGKARRGVDHAFREHGIGDYFLTVQTADNHPSKPHPSMLEQALRETGAEKDHAVMIGDTTFDIQMGRAAGFRTVGVTWGYHATEDLKSAGADVLIDRYSDLPDVLNDMWRAS